MVGLKVIGFENLAAGNTKLFRCWWQVVPGYYREGLKRSVSNRQDPSFHWWGAPLRTEQRTKKISWT